MEDAVNRRWRPPVAGTAGSETPPNKRRSWRPPVAGTAGSETRRTRDEVGDLRSRTWRGRRPRRTRERQNDRQRAGGGWSVDWDGVLHPYRSIGYESQSADSFIENPIAGWHRCVYRIRRYSILGNWHCRLPDFRVLCVLVDRWIMRAARGERETRWRKGKGIRTRIRDEMRRGPLRSSKTCHSPRRRGRVI